MGCDYCERPVGASHAVTCPLKGYVTERTAPPLATSENRVAELEAAPAANGAAVGTCNTFCGERECERTDPTQCKRGEPQPARGALTAEEREASTEAMKCMTKLRRERDEANAECERLRVAHLKAALERDRANEARGRIRSEWTRRGQSLHAAQQTIGALNARVAELEAAPAASGAANSPGSPVSSEPVAWGVLMPNQDVRTVCLFRNTEEKAKENFPESEGWTHFPLFTSPPPARGWLTEEERRLIERLKESAESFPPSMHYFEKITIREALVMFDALLARSTPPRVKVPKYFPMSWAHERDDAWIAAIREAGGEVEE